ncbi:extracellular solute-binding protein [Roseivivax sp. GX 12232]|uniref:extracellular solute-binding protein n=1 Tax=Roseivivax sp. GX 12232 TaxID=2900547 RepID=UPI001E53377B|nr:extracellular solute-binding protein [Roseivivax sp. GX 12232]MCE0507062.1 extracellular solute-binding protein [Roseivivax sp. GX 12232]
MTRFVDTRLTRREALVLFGGAAATGLGGLPRPGFAAAHSEVIRSHGYSFYGDLQYPEDFPHFSYVNPDAPRGGEIILSDLGTFDGFNRWASQGRPEGLSSVVAESMFGDGPWGTPTPADSLTDAYGLLAEAVEYPEGKEWCVFHMRPEARFSNGTPVTAHDALFTHNLFLEQGIRSYARAVKERIAGVEVIDDHTIRFEFVDGISRRSLIEQVGGTPVFSKAWYEETGERLDKPSLNSPMASGPYVVGDYEINRYVVYERNPDYWGWHLPINVGRHNFDRVRIEYFADDSADFEAFKAGVYTFRPEGSTKRWATGYDFPKVEEGTVKREEIATSTAPQSTGIIYNTQRAPFDDKTVRQALGLMYNFEWTRESLQYGLTSVRESFLQGTEMAASGLPGADEKAFLEALGDVVPPALYTEEAVVPHTSDPASATDRRNMRQALRLLREAGYEVGDDGRLRDGEGNPLEVEFLISSATGDTVEALVTTYVGNLQALGVDARVEKIDTAQIQQRFLDKDYDVLFTRYVSFMSVGTGLKQMFGSETAEVSSYNPATLKSPLVDAIIEKALDADSREEEVTALKVLDRALRWERIVISSGYVAEAWVAYYDLFGRPDELPPLSVGYLDFWWYDEDKAEALKASGALR